MSRWTWRTCGLVVPLWLCMREGVTCSSCWATSGSMRYSITRTCRGADKPWQVLGSRVGRLAAIGQHLLFAGKDTLRQPTQHMSPSRANGLQQGSREKAAIDQHEHAGFERRQQ